MVLERQPLYEQVRQQVLGYILENDLEPGDAIPTEAELANRYGVSLGTTRRALQDLVERGILYRQPGRGTFLTEHGRERARQRGLLACIVPHIRDAFFGTIVAGAQDAAQRSDYAFLLYNTDGQPALEERFLRQSLANADGILLLPLVQSTPSPTLEEILRRRFPLVFVDRLPAPTTENINLVSCDNRNGAYAAVQHLIELGHRRIALALTAGAQLNSSVAQRTEGYHRALRDYGLQADRDLVLDGLTARFQPADGAPAGDRQRDPNILVVEDFLRQREPSALFAVNDLIAVDAWRAARNLGLSVPEDLSIVGFDGAQSLGELGIPLTTVTQEAPEISRSAVELLIECIRGRVTVPRTVLLPTQLVVRASTQLHSTSRETAADWA
jgi:GntR family transcriptional regulator of arabinose operon